MRNKCSEFLFISLWNVLIIETITVLSDAYIYCKSKIEVCLWLKEQKKSVNSPNT